MGSLTVKESGEMINFISPNVSKITSFKVHFSPKQEGTGDPSPENVREITGWNGVEGYISNVAQSYSSTSNTLIAAIDWTEDIGTIYGGYVDLVSGELIANMAIVDLGTLIWLYNEQYTVFISYPINLMSTSTYKKGICSQYKITDQWLTSQGWADNDKIFSVRGQDSRIRIKDTTYTDASVFKASVNGTQFVYELATPITYQLTPQQLSTLKGQNNFWSNADYVEIEYELTETFDIQKAKRKIILSQPHVETASGNIVTFDTDMKGKLKECKVYFSPVQEGEGDPSPDNVRNITGWNGITATRNGKNLVKVSAETRVYQNPTSNTNFTEDNNIIIITGSSNGGYRASCKPNTQYTYSCKPTLKSGGVYLRVWKEIGEKRNMIINQNVNSTKGAVATFTTGSDVYSLVVGFYVYSTAAQTGLTISDFQLELGDTRTAYEPYQSTAISIDWTDSAGTIYGGYVDLISGELVQEFKQCKINELSWSYFSDGACFATSKNTPNDILKNKSLLGSYIRSNYYTPIDGYVSISAYADKQDYSISLYATSDQYRIFIKDSRFTDVSSFLSAMGDTYIWYRLAEPTVTYQLTPQQLTALRGTNTIYSNANEQIDIKYWTRFPPKINYMKDVQWLDHSYITSAGKLTQESTAPSHTTVDSILLPAGNYRIDGFCYQEPPANSLNCRVHEYSAGGSWIKLITSNVANTMSPYILEFSLDHNSYIKLSLPRLLDAKLIKI